MTTDNNADLREENPSKRKNLTRWRESRYRRLYYAVRTGWASLRQKARCEQLARALFEKGVK